jgi:hypothetical protein
MTGAAAAAIAAHRASDIGQRQPSPWRAHVAVLMVALWSGAALLFTTVVAPAAFAVLPSRMLAGAVVGRVLPVVFVSGMIVAGVAGLLRRRSGAPRRLAWRAGLVLLLAGCAVAQFGIGPRIQQLRAELPADLESVPADDARRVAFGKLHGISVAFLGLGMTGALVALMAGAWPARRLEDT